MVDNVLLNAGSGGDTIATEDIAGVEYQLVKLVNGLAASSARIEAGAGDPANALRIALATVDNAVLDSIDASLSNIDAASGITPYKNLDVDETEDAVKATPGELYMIHAMNLSAAVRYLKFYNATVATVIVGTTVPDFTFPIPTQADTNGAGFVLVVPNGITFGTAITIAVTTGFADADAGAPGANEVIVNLGFI